MLCTVSAYVSSQVYPQGQHIHPRPILSLYQTVQIVALPKTSALLISCFRDVKHSRLWNAVQIRLVECYMYYFCRCTRRRHAGRQRAGEYPQYDWQSMSQCRPWPRCHGTLLSSATSVLLGVATTIKNASTILFKLNVVQITHDFPNNPNTSSPLRIVQILALACFEQLVS